LEDLKLLPRERWATTRVQTIMRPVVPRFFVEPSATLDSAQALMKENGVGSIAVINTRGQLVAFSNAEKSSGSGKPKLTPISILGSVLMKVSINFKFVVPQRQAKAYRTSN